MLKKKKNNNNHLGVIPAIKIQFKINESNGFLKSFVNHHPDIQTKCNPRLPDSNDFKQDTSQ